MKSVINNTMLRRAAREGTVGIVQKAIADRCDLNMRFVHDWTPLHHAAKGGHPEIVTLLVKGNAELNPFNDMWQTPLDLTQNKAVAKILADASGLKSVEASIHAAAFTGDLGWVKKHASAKNEINSLKQGYTPLCIALMRQKTEVVNYLLRLKPDVKKKQANGETALHIAAEYNASEAAMNTILKLGADVNAINDYGGAPICSAASAGDLDAVRFLINKGANLTRRVARGADPVSAALDQGNDEIARALIEEGAKATLSVGQSLALGAIVSSANPALPGTNVTFTMTVGAVAPGSGTPNGTVNFRIDGSVAGSGTLSGGTATFTTSTLAHGSHTVVSEYAGNLNFAGVTNSLTPDQVINTPPIAGNFTIVRYPTTGVKVRLSTLLTNDSDADGDVLQIAVSSNSVNGATITTNGGWVFYTPASGFTNADSFTYTITDGHGGSAVATVTVGIIVDNNPSQNLVITALGNGSFRIDGNGIPGRTYRLQFSDSMSPYL